jgi:hypothetical protein
VRRLLGLPHQFPGIAYIPTPNTPQRVIERVENWMTAANAQYREQHKNPNPELLLLPNLKGEPVLVEPSPQYFLPPPPTGFGFHKYNPWIEFMRANRGRFHSLAELPHEYHRRR